MEAFNIYLPIAGLHFNVLILLLIGFTVGVCGGFFGIGGAWIVTPALNIFGFPMPYAIGTDLAHIGGKSIVSTMRHGRFGNVDVKLGVAMIMGTTIGMELGANLVLLLERAGLAETVIRKAYIVFLALIGSYVLYDYLSHRSRLRKAMIEGTAPDTGPTFAHRLQRIRIPPMMHFKTSGITCSMWLPLLVGLTTGIVASVLGVGGGFIRMPALIYLIGCPTAIAVGTDLFSVLFSGAYGCFTYGIKGRVEIIAAVLMLIGAAIGAQIGTVATKYAKGYGIRVAFGTAVVCCMISIILKQFGFSASAAALILGTISLICLYIIKIMFVGAAAELRAKKQLKTSAGY